MQKSPVVDVVNVKSSIKDNTNHKRRSNVVIPRTIKDKMKYKDLSTLDMNKKASKHITRKYFKNTREYNITYLADKTIINGYIDIDIPRNIIRWIFLFYHYDYADKQ